MLNKAKIVAFSEATGVYQWQCRCEAITTATPASYDSTTQTGYYGDDLYFCAECGTPNGLR